MKTKEEIKQLAEKLYVEPLNKQGEQRTHTPKSGGMYGFKKFKKYFTLGYTQCQEDNKDKKYTEEDLRKAFYYGGKSAIDEYGSFETYINSLNKKD